MMKERLKGIKKIMGGLKGGVETLERLGEIGNVVEEQAGAQVGQLDAQVVGPFEREGGGLGGSSAHLQEGGGMGGGGALEGDALDGERGSDVRGGAAGNTLQREDQRRRQRVEALQVEAQRVREREGEVRAHRVLRVAVAEEVQRGRRNGEAEERRIRRRRRRRRRGRRRSTIMMLKCQVVRAEAQCRPSEAVEPGAVDGEGRDRREGE